MKSYFFVFFIFIGIFRYLKSNSVWFLDFLALIVVVPFVLFAFYYSLSDQIKKHKKVVKYTFPIWLYVSVSGVIVYLMISPFYKF